MTESLPMKCRKCRFVILSYPETRVESNHGALATEAVSVNSNNRLCATDVWYIPEDHVPAWMISNIEKGGWVKGKVQCPKCDARIGSYNFVSGMKCPCSLEVAAPIHIVKSKVDFFIAPSPPTSGTSLGESTSHNKQVSGEQRSTSETDAVNSDEEQT